MSARFILVTLFFCLGLSTNKAQIPDNPSLETQWVDLFPKKLVQDHGIKSIRATYAIKYDRQKMHFTNRELRYYFDEKARLIKMVELNIYGNRLDSVVDQYFYEGKHYLSTQLHSDAQSNTVYKIEREGNSTISSAYLIPKDLTWNVNLNSTFLLWSDSIRNEQNRVTYYNRYKKPYKYYVEEPSDNRAILKISEYFQGGKINSIQTLKIKDDKVVTSIEEKNFNKLLFNWKREYFYDDNYLLLQEQYFKKGMLASLRKISYGSDGLPEVDITRDEATTRMTIVQYTYEKSK